jgi:phenol hydroxylase P0 protein
MSQPGSTFDQMPRYIRVRSEPDATFVEFDFAIGYPDLFVELVLPRQAFRQFCENNRVQHMDAQMSDALDADAQKWRYGETRDADQVADHPTQQKPQESTP